MAAQLRIEKIHLSATDDPDDEWLELKNGGDLPFVAWHCTLAIAGPDRRTRRVALRDSFTLPPGERSRLISGKARGEPPPRSHYLFQRRTLFAPGDTVRLLDQRIELCQAQARSTQERQWIKHRPRVKVRVVGGAVPGERLLCEVEIDAKRAVPIDGVAATLRGFQRTTVGSGSTASSRRVQVIEQQAQLGGARTLPAGVHHHRVAFALPPALPPTFGSTRVDVRYTLAIHVVIPWWPDRRAAFEIVLAFPPRARPSQPLVAVSGADGPQGLRPYAELSVANATVAVGGALTGAVALYNVAQVTYRALRLHVQRTVVVSVGQRDAQEQQSLLYDIELPLQLEEGRPIPFACGLPARLPCSFDAVAYDNASWRIGWRLEAEVVVAWSRNLRLSLPLVVVRDEGPRSPLLASQGRRGPELAPAVGNERVDALWRALAAEHGLQLADGQLSRSNASWSLLLRREQREGGKRLLVAELLPAESLGLGLRVEPTLLGRFSGVALGRPDFDYAHRVQGHDREQLAQLLLPWIERWPARFRLEADDRSLRVLTPGSGQQREALEALLRVAIDGLEGLAARQAALPLPAALARTAPFWQELERRLERARFDRGAVRLVGQRVGRAVRIASCWSDAQADALVDVLDLRVEGELSARFCHEALTARDVAGLPEFSAEARRHLELVLVGERRLTLEPRGARLLLPWASAEVPQTAGPELAAWVDEQVLAPLGELAALLDVLAGRGGPYR